MRQEDRHELSQLVTAIRQQYNENAKQIERTWGGGIMGIKSQAKKAVLERAIAKEAAKKARMESLQCSVVGGECLPPGGGAAWRARGSSQQVLAAASGLLELGASVREGER